MFQRSYNISDMLMVSSSQPLCNTDSMSMELSPEVRLLEQVVQDPAIARLQKEVRELNELLAVSNEVTKQELEAIAYDLDAKWLPLLKHGAVISGVMKFPKPGSFNPETGEFEVEERYYDEQPVQIQDFVIASDHIRLDEENVITHPVIALRVARDREEYEVDKGDVESYVGTAFPERVEISPFMMSFERAKAWLEYHYSEALEDMEARILNASGSAQALVNLNDFSVELHHDETIDQARQAFSVYLENMIPFEYQVPYSAVIEGTGYVPKDDGHAEAYIAENNYLVYFYDFYLVSGDGVDEGRYFPLVKLNILHPDNDHSDLEVIAELSSIQSVSSIREAHYGN